MAKSIDIIKKALYDDLENDLTTTRGELEKIRELLRSLIKVVDEYKLCFAELIIEHQQDNLCEHLFGSYEYWMAHLILEKELLSTRGVIE